MRERLRQHWPEYAIEAWALGTFMVSAGLCTLVIEHPDFGVRGAIASDAVRRLLIGLAMGATAIALIYSPWGQRSGAHMNPAVTLTFFSLGKVERTDALLYVAAQFVGGVAGVALVLALAGERFAGPPIELVTTRPGHGAALAFACEWLISCVLMSVVLALSSRPKIARYTGLAAGALVATFIALEAPYSGMSMNPARSWASAAVAGDWSDLWIYLIAPPLGMWTAGRWHRRRGAHRGGCAKLVHGSDVRCIHCGYEPHRGTEPVLPGGLPNVTD
jgi:aquaporin Z